MTPNLVKSKKLVFWMFLKGIEAHTEVKKLQLSVHRTVTDLQADSLATYYTLSVTSWTRRRPQPLFPRGKKGEEIGVRANLYPMTVENNLKI